MSLEAITWALAQPISHSSAKFILVVLSNCANAESMEAYPSTSYLAEATGQDRKTVLANLARLRDWGFIEATGSKKGSTGQVIVYRLKSPENGTVEQSQKRNSTTPIDKKSDPHYGTSRHYVYRVHRPDTGQFYIGVRMCVGAPDDDKYTGSGRWPTSCEASGVQLTKAVVSVHVTREEAEREERRLIDAALADPLCMNSPKSGTVAEKQTVPFLDGNSPVFPSKQSRFSAKQSQKRDTEPSETSGKRRSNQKSAPKHALDCPSDVDQQTWSDWLALRKAKRAPVTETVVRGARAEAAKAGMTLTAFLEVWCQRGSQGLQAEWLKPNERAGPKGNRPAVNASFANEIYTGTPVDELFDQFPAH